MYKSFILAFALGLLSLCSGRPECRKAICETLNPATTDPNKFVCAAFSVEQNSYLIEACPGGATANCNMKEISFYKNVTCKAPKKNVGLPGDVCDQASDCSAKNECVTNRCKGLGIGATCGVNEECDIGSFCGAMKCTKTAQIGEECSNTMLCDPYATCVKGICTFKYSLPDGTNLTSAGQESACQSSVSSKPEGYLQCSVGRKLQGYTGQPMMKPYDQDCYYTDEEGETEATYSACTFSTDGQCVCPPGLGDLTDKFTILARYAHVKPLCHVTSGFFCNRAYETHKKTYLNARVAQIDIKYYAAYVNPPECVKQISPYYAYYQMKAEAAKLPDDPDDTYTSTTTTDAKSLSLSISMLFISLFTYFF
jgi:hypothetical protein